MANVFPVDTRLHRKFDLKGSTYGRTAGDKKDDPNANLKVIVSMLPVYTEAHKNITSHVTLLHIYRW